MNTAVQLATLPRNKEFFIGYDSDGCVFDTMELKHKTCFGPAAVNRFHLEDVATIAKDVWNFVNLYSQTRGCNRFIGLRHFLDILAAHPEVCAKSVQVPKLDDLTEWINVETRRGNDTLQRRCRTTGSEELRQVLAWSNDVNCLVEATVRVVDPIPGVEDALRFAQNHADQIVVSQASQETLGREWGNSGLTKLVRFLAGQELGSKTEHIRSATAGKGYLPDRILMVGDAPGDQRAAEANQALFFPIIPGKEASSWQRFTDEGLARFLDGRFAGDFQRELLAEFEAALPANRTWN